MHQIYKKVKSEKGASMILALALVLICVTVASIIVMAASSGASRGLTRTQQQRGYLTVSSAAQLVAEELEDVGTMIANQQWYQYDCEIYEEYISDEYGGVFREGYLVTDFGVSGALNPIMTDLPHNTSVVTVVDGDSVSGLFADVLTTATQHIYTTGSSYSEEITIAPVIADERLGTAICTFTMDVGYNVKVQITTADSDYTATVTMDKDNSAGSGETVVLETSTHTHTVYYKKLQGDAYVAAQMEVNRDGQLVSKTQSITWKAPTVRKGGASE